MRDLFITIVASIWFKFQELRYEYFKYKNYKEIERDMRKAGLL